jgi:hypothetical protein
MRLSKELSSRLGVSELVEGPISRVRFAEKRLASWANLLARVLSRTREKKAAFAALVYLPSLFLFLDSISILSS